MTRRSDGSIQRSIHRKATWSGQYIQFSSFTPIAYKRGLVRTLYHRARCICSPDTIDEEERFLRKILLSNGYPEKFITIHSKRAVKAEPIHSVPKKMVYLKLDFKGDHLLNDVRQKIKSALNRAFPAAQLRLISSTRGICLDNIGHNRLENSASHVVYQFTCSCGDTYIGRTNRQLSQRVSEHIPKWLVKSMTHESSVQFTDAKNPGSSIAKHLLMSNHKVDPVTSFKPILRNRNHKLLAFSEAMLIRLRNPKLCAQKCLTQSIRLPWR